MSQKECARNINLLGDIIRKRQLDLLKLIIISDRGQSIVSVLTVIGEGSLSCVFQTYGSTFLIEPREGVFV